jgi:hypothetical protein
MLNVMTSNLWFFAVFSGMEFYAAARKNEQLAGFGARIGLSAVGF